jgi:tetraprenyl-beta-curcumene synthase
MTANAASVDAEAALPEDSTRPGQGAGRRGAPLRAGPMFGERRLLARAGLALLLANVRYWTTVAPAVRGQLERWQQRADTIADPGLRTLALQKLEAERFNTEAGAMLATLAPRAQRANVVEAIVALQVLFDLLDGLTEQPLEDPLRDGERLFSAFIDALRPPTQAGATSSGEDGGYLEELSSVARNAVARLPAAAAVLAVAQASAQRAAQAQIRMHATPRLGTDQLRAWAQSEARGTGLQWQELTAGAASSVLAVHALIAAAADARSTPAQAARIEAAYMSICALLTLLDGLIDHETDEWVGELGYLGLYEDRGLLGPALSGMAARAARQAYELPDGVQHLVMLTGVVAYYASAPGASGELARPLIRQARSSLRPLISPTLLVMRAWRLARRLRGRD